MLKKSLLWYEKFFSNTQGGLSKRFVSSWSPDELKFTMYKYGDDSWFRKIYLRLSPILIIEVSIFVFGLLLLALLKSTGD